MKYWLCNVMTFCLVSTPTYALTPPRGGEMSCLIQGKVLAQITEEASDAQMQRFPVPVMIVDVYKTTPQNQNTPKTSCSLPIRITNKQHFIGTKRAGYYRLCEKEIAAPAVGQRIEAIVGRSLGGGRVCIENIKRIKK